MNRFVLCFLVSLGLVSNAWGQENLNPRPTSDCPNGFQGDLNLHVIPYQVHFVGYPANLNSSLHIDLLRHAVPNSALKDDHPSTEVVFTIPTKTPSADGRPGVKSISLAYQIEPMDFGFMNVRSSRFETPEYGGSLSGIVVRDRQYLTSVNIPTKFSSIGETQLAEFPTEDFSLEFPLLAGQGIQWKDKSLYEVNVVPTYLGWNFVRALRIMNRLRGNDGFSGNAAVEKFLTELSRTRASSFDDGEKVLRSYERRWGPLRNWLFDAAAGAILVSAAMLARDGVAPEPAVNVPAVTPVEHQSPAASDEETVHGLDRTHMN